MFRATATVCLVCLAGFASALAVDGEIKADLKNGKYTPAFQTTDTLIGYNDGDEKAFFYINGSVEMPVKIPAAGDYTITIKASGNSAMKENPKFTLSINGKELAKGFELKEEVEKEYPFPAKLDVGECKIKIEYTNDVHKEGEYDRNLYLHAVTVKKK